MAYRVGVVGFGVAGASAALLLARAGHDVTVYERAREGRPPGTGLLLQSDGVVKGWGRDLGLPLMLRVGPFRRRMVATAAGVQRGFLGGRLEP